MKSAEIKRQLDKNFGITYTGYAEGIKATSDRVKMIYKQIAELEKVINALETQIDQINLLHDAICDLRCDI